ncbi:hypothetical protein P7C70_g526, partial [Phenoliferia sp. Uapishka_3]
MGSSPITIPYCSLLSPSAATSTLLHSAFSTSPTSQGLLLISDLPPSLNFPALRLRLLGLSNDFASLPEDVKESYADASSRENCLAFQTGETLSLLSSDRLAATPHFVNAASDETVLSPAAVEVVERKKREDPDWRNVVGGTVSRETLAVFLQPNDDEVVSVTGETFGEFGDRVLGRHYEPAA